MNWSHQPAAEGELGSAGHTAPLAAIPTASRNQQAIITVGKATILDGNSQESQVFTLSLGGESINLLPLRNWSQQDVHKWRARGFLPSTPPGLEITPDHVRVAGETVSINDPAGVLKLQKLLNEWLALERGSLLLSQQKAHAAPAAAASDAAASTANLPPRFVVDMDKDAHVHIRCLQGKEVLAAIGLNQPGLTSLINQGLMHKPHALKVGAMHDWIELDGEFFSFEKGNNESARLEKALNERYLSTELFGHGKEVVVFPNAASPTGFDIQFPAREAGRLQQRRRPFNEDALALLQDPSHCGLLPRDLVLKLSPPNLIFKRKTPDGGEAYLARHSDHMVTVTGDDGQVKQIDLSQPVSYLRLTALELTAVFNHPAVNQHAAREPERQSGVPVRVVRPLAQPPPKPAPIMLTEPAPPRLVEKPVVLKAPDAAPPVAPAPVVRPRPNLWLEPILSHPPARPEWFAFLVYRKMAEHFGNSTEGYFGPHPCWASSLGEVEEICDPGFRGVFLTQKGGLGYLNQGHLARFRNEVAFVGTLESAIEGIGVKVFAVGMDAAQRIVFIVSEGYAAAFGMPQQAVAVDLARLRDHGACLMSRTEVIQSAEPLELVWSVPAQEEGSADPQAVENLRPEAGA